METLMTVLLIDDNFDLRTTIAFGLENRGLRVIQASDGKQGLEVLENERVDLVISDVQMPVMDGMSFLMECQKRFKTPPPIFIMTGGCDYSANEFLSQGAKAFFSKPFDINKILNWELAS